MTQEHLRRQIEAAHQRLQVLRERTVMATESESAAVQDLALQTLEELGTSLEELGVAAEELSAQNEELAAARLYAEMERKRYQELFDWAPDGYLVTDLDGVIQEANRTAAAFLGVRQDFLVGKPLLVFVADAQMGRKAFHTQLTQLYTEWADLVTQPLKDLQIWLQPREGASFPVEMTVGRTHDAHGRLTGLRWLARDITRRKRAEEALQMSEARYRAIVEDQTELILRFLPDGSLTFANGAFCRNLGKTYEAVMERNLMLLMPASDWMDIERRLALLTEENPVMTYEHRTALPDGRMGWQQWSTRGLYDDEGNLVEYQSVGHDITERKQMEDALRQSNLELEARNGELDAFDHTVAHDLKNPLSMIMSFTESLENDYVGMSGEELAWHIHSIALGARALNHIIDELLLLAGVRKAQVQVGLLDMDSIVHQARRRVSDLIEEHRAALILPDKSAWPAAVGHAEWIVEVWVNYLENAIKYGSESPQVELGANVQPDGMVRFWIHDDGDGLAPEDQGRLFTPFTRLRQTHIQGHGLGLSIVKRIVEKLGGQVGVTSAGEPGQGSVFFFTLPNATAPTTPIAA